MYAVKKTERQTAWERGYGILTCYDLEGSSPRGTALRVCCGFAPNAFGSQPHSRNLPNHSHKPEVQLLERHLRLTVRALYTQCMIHSPDIAHLDEHQKHISCNISGKKNDMSF